MRSDLVGYIKLIEAFVSHDMTGAEFETAYLQKFKDDDVIYDDAAFTLLDTLFANVDEYFDDPDFSYEQRQRELDQLRSCAKTTLEELVRLPG